MRALLLVLVLLGGCQMIPTAPQQGGSDVMFLAEEWYDDGKLKSRCTLGREGLSQYPQGVEVQVSADDSEPGCKVKLEIPEVVQGDASLTRLTLEQRAAAMAELLALLRGLVPLVDQ